MKGAVAAGHPLTAEAGARILREGGNAVDACIAAAFVSWVAESPLTGPGGGGFMLVHRARDRTDRLLDFFVAVPGRGLPPDEGGEMAAVEVRFDERTTQVFLIGPAACAVPGSLAGLAAAHKTYARLPWAELVAPAIEVARAGLPLNAAQAFLHDILDGILRSEPEGRQVYGRRCPIREGEPLVMEELADTLVWIAAEGADVLYRGELAQRLAAAVGERGGRVTEADLAEFRVIRRRPVRAAYRDAEFVSNPPPSSGGLLIAFALRVLDRLGEMPPAGGPEALASLAFVMREATRVRGPAFLSELFRGGAARRILADERVEASAREAGAGLAGALGERAGHPSTTHISVLDARGNAASLSASTGCGSGFFVPRTGIQLNNMLGEPDLNPGGAAATPGARLTSMMAPSLVLAGGTPRLVVGSAGSIRLRAAILQIVANVVDQGMTVEDAIEAPRVHLEGDVLQLEGGIAPDTADRLEEAGIDVVRWDGRNLYFGGAAAVGVRQGGGLEAAGDSRRSGAGVVVSA
ncbi:MAG TPA: gamma-glutamyltransferase [Gaiellaceae bacterium]|jgi:gamma-glutamyltranspeptidase/glutathione hydrolase